MIDTKNEKLPELDDVYFTLHSSANTKEAQERTFWVYI